jgi:hypothetical protein
VALPFGDFAKPGLIISTIYDFEALFTVKLKLKIIQTPATLDGQSHIRAGHPSKNNIIALACTEKSVFKNA